MLLAGRSPLKKGRSFWFFLKSPTIMALLRARVGTRFLWLSPDLPLMPGEDTGWTRPILSGV